MMADFKILMYKGDSFWSKFIKPAINSSYSHCGILIDDVLVFETDVTYNVKLRLLKYKRSDYDLYEIKNLTNQEKDKIREFIYNHLNDKYSRWENIRVLFKLWFGINVFDDPSKRNCVELIIDALSNANIMLTEEDPAIFENIISNDRLELIKQ